MASKMAYSAAQGQIRMYHVTNVPAEEDQPDWKEVMVNVADDSYFDRDLVGLPVACFTTTLYNDSLPTRSPYPRQLADGGKPEEGINYWRVDVPFNPSNFDIFEMAKVDKQIRLLCLEKNPRPDGKEKLLAKIIPQKFTCCDLNKYFPNNQANEYNQQDIKLKFFVNVCFINPVSIADGEWTQVKHRKTNRWDLRGRFAHNDESHDIRLRKWGEEQLRSSQGECNKLLRKNLSSADTRNFQQIEYFMQKGIEALQKQWKGLFDQEAEHINKSDVQVDKLVKDFSSHKFS